MALEMAGGFILNVFFEGGKHILKTYKNSDLKELDETLSALLPQVDKLWKVTVDSTSDPMWEEQIREHRNKLQQAQNRQKSMIFWEKAELKEKLVREITQFQQNVLLPTMKLDLDKLSAGLKNMVGLMQKFVFDQEICYNSVISEFEEKRADFAGQTFQISQRDRELSSPPLMPSCLIGFEEHVEELKKIVLEPEGRADVLGITAIGGAGKSALATALCHDREIKEHFKERIIYIIVTERPDCRSALKTMWTNIVGHPEPPFTSAEDLHKKLEFQIQFKINEPILVVLDDIWESSDLKELLFKGEQYMTVVTTREKRTIDSIQPCLNKAHYKLPVLQEEHALSLFCHWAFGESTIPDTHDEELVKQVQAECKGSPLALKVIGSSLNGEPDSVWEATRDALAKGKATEENQIEATRDALAKGEATDENPIEPLLKRLETSIGVLSPSEKQCFLDLAVFPKRRSIPANVLLDIWVYVRRMRRNEAVGRLRKFGDCHLLDLKRSDPWTPESTDDSMNSYSFSQHDVMRQLAMFLAEQDNKIRLRRLYMAEKQSLFPPEWQMGTYQSSRAQIVSIHTGKMEDTQWSGLDFPVAEALVLYFSATEYCIPTFLDTMKRLKVLIIYNDNSKPAKLCGLGGFQGTSQLKTLYLERLIVPPLNEDCKGLKSLEKISLVLCEGLGKDTIFNFPGLLEINVDYCIDLEELPAGLCSSVSLKKLSITHCHRLAKLPDEMDRLESLKEIILFESPSLKALPPKISSLRKLEYLDISSCIGLKVTRQGRRELKSTLEAVAELPSLKRVICDKRNEGLFKRSSRANLKVQAVEEEEPNLDWLDLEEEEPNLDWLDLNERNKKRKLEA